MSVWTCIVTVPNPVDIMLSTSQLFSFITTLSAMDKFLYLVSILTMFAAFSTLNAMNIIDCSSRSIHFDGSTSINITCGVCCTGDDDYCPPQDGEINLQIVKHSEINLTKYNLGWIPDSCKHSLVLCPDCYQNYSTESLLTFEGFNGSYNNLRVIPCFSQWSNLKWIDLSHNNIGKLSYSLYCGNNSVLEKLMLRGNGLEKVYHKLILNLKGLQYLDLRNNTLLNDYSFTKHSTSLTFLDLRFSCNDYVVICPACETNLTLLVINSSACSIESQCNATNCTFSYDDFEMKSSHQCLEVDHSTLYTSTTAITTPSVHSSSVSFNETEAEAFCSKFSNFFHLPLIISQRSYCSLTISVFAMLFVIGVIMIIYLIRWRIKVRREGRYGRWMSIYSPKVAYQAREGKSEDSSNYRVLNNSSGNIRMDCDGTSKHSSRCSISNEEVIIDPNLESLENIRMKCKVTVERSKSHVDDNCKKAVSGSLKSKRKTRSMPGQYSSQRPPQGNNKVYSKSSINTTDVDLSSSENVLRKKKMGGRVPGRRSLGIGKTDYEELSKSSLQNQKCSKSDWKIYDGLKKV